MEIPEGKKEKIADCLQAILAAFNLEDYHFVLSIVEFKPKKAYYTLRSTNQCK